jgi:hypothetical protein
MKGSVPLDPQTNVSQVCFAVVYTKRKSRKRFPAGCVQLKETEQEAIAAADDANNYFPAHVAGPSKSSEGQFIYYLVRWI